MFHRNHWFNRIAALTLIIAAASCDGLGAGCGCTMQPLPAGGLPADQTIEGGAQIRVTPSGFEKITALIPAVVNDALAGGFCLPSDGVSVPFVGSASVCKAAVGQCAPGCPTTVTLLSTDITANDKTLHLVLHFRAHVDVTVSYTFIAWGGSCEGDLDLDDGSVEVDVRLAIDRNTGELTVEPADVKNMDLTGTHFTGCGALGSLFNAVESLLTGLLDTFVGDLVLDLVRPLIDDLMQGLLPDPLGVEGVVDVSNLLGVLSPEANASIELRSVPGGFVNLVGNGMTLGVITGINADRDRTTRTPDRDNEPSLCVPPVAAPDFAAPPSLLPRSERGTFTLAAAGEFRGAPDPAADIAIGLSETTLDLAGHHALTSGSLCAGIGTAQVPQLDLGRIGLLVPSLAALGSPDGKDPLLLVTRPQKAIDFAVGDGTPESPSLTLHVQDLEIDFYAFLFERYVRGFTVSVDLDVGVNIDFTITESGRPALLPVLVGLSSENIRIRAINTDLLAESSAELEATLPAVLDLALPLVTGNIPPIELPDVAGFTLGNLRVEKVVTSEDEFLGIFASLTTSAALQRLADRYPSVRDIAGPAEPAPERARTRATLRRVTTPAIEQVRTALLQKSVRDRSTGLPEVVVDVAPVDERGRALEWTWSLNGGMWRSFTRQTPLVIRDPALAWQGRHDIRVRARVAGDYRTLDTESVVIPVVIDSVGPRIHGDRARVEHDILLVPATDLISPAEALELAFGHPDDSTPATEWGVGGLALDHAAALAKDGRIAVYARDEQQNTTRAVVDISRVVPGIRFHHGSGGGCQCAAGGTDARSLGGLGLLVVLTGFFLLSAGRRRGFAAFLRRRVLSRVFLQRSAVLWGVFFVAVLAGAAFLPACDCGGAIDACEIPEDCDDYCPGGTVGVCLENTCFCQDDVAYGRIGQYSAVALAPDGDVWVSAYNSTHGDLNVARWAGSGPISDETWQFVDGVPDGPVTVQRSTVRGGIEAAGPNVGTHTSLATGAAGEPMVSYFDEDTASLKFAVQTGGQWQVHTVEAGTPRAGVDAPFELVGRYSSLTVDTDGRPGIAYYAHVFEGAGAAARTEVRYAMAASPAPRGFQDWTFYTIDEAVLPPEDPGVPDILGLPPGLGLFVTSARQNDQTPVVAYYDRMNGDLKMARFDAAAGIFAAPVVLDGQDADVGWYASVAVDAQDNVHVSYVNATEDDLMYVSTIDNVPEIVDSGYRVAGTTEDGLPRPEYHLVGDDSNLVLTPGGPVIVYQDATAHELVLAQKDAGGAWQPSAIAGNETQFAGAYGFYASAAFDGRDVVMSTWALDPLTDAAWVEVFRQPVTR